MVEALRARVEHGIYGYTVPYDEVVQETLAYLSRVHQLDIRPEWSGCPAWCPL